MLKADTLSVSTRWNFVTDAVLMDGQRKDATHSTIWLMPRPLLMNYAKLCPREWSHMFIMKAAGVLEIPWVAPNELHVTGRRDTQHGAMEEGGGKKKKDTTYSRFNRMHSSGNLEFWRGSASLVWVCAWPFCPSGGVAVGWVWNEEKPPWWMSTPPNADWHLELNWNTVAILWQNAYNCSRCTRTTIRYLYLRLDHHETGVTASVSPCNKTPLVP